jgi:hypothetical protein
MAMKKMMMILLTLFMSVLSVSTLDALEITYTYDSLNRLTSAVYTSGGNTKTLTYVYDPLGNRTLFRVNSPTTRTIIINAEPDAMNTVAPWILTDPNSHSQSGTGDQIFINSPVGNYMILWGDVSGWTKPSPASSTQTLTSGGTITFSGTYVQLPVIQVTQSILNFGYVPPGSYKDLTLTVKNTGGGTLTGSVTACPPFSVVLGGGYSLGAGEFQPVIVRYTAPLQEGSQTCSFVFSGGGGFTVQVKGTNEKFGLPWLMLLLD